MLQVHRSKAKAEQQPAEPKPAVQQAGDLGSSQVFL